MLVDAVGVMIPVVRVTATAFPKTMAAKAPMAVQNVPKNIAFR